MVVLPSRSLTGETQKEDKMNAILQETMDELENMVVPVALKLFNNSVANTQRMADLYASVGYKPKPGKNSMFLEPERCERTREWIKGEDVTYEDKMEMKYADMYLDRAKAMLIPDWEE